MPAPKRAQWVSVWNSSFKNCKDKNKGGGAGSDQDCEAIAFKFANGVVAKKEINMIEPGATLSLEDAAKLKNALRSVADFLDRTVGEGAKATVTKTEGGVSFPAGDYAYVPDPKEPSTWKLRLTEAPGKTTVEQVARAITALQPGGFRGNVVQIPSGDKGGVVSKISSAIENIPGADDAQKKNLHSRLTAVKVLGEDEKCGGCSEAPSEYEPFGGAQSFAEADKWHEIVHQRAEVEQETDLFRIIINNIMQDDELTVAQKATKIAAASSELSDRVANPPEEEKSLEDDEIVMDEKEGKRINKSWLEEIKSAVGVLTKLLGWARYEDTPIEEKIGEEPVVPVEGNFKVYRDKVGDLRWLAFSSNAFKDREGEIFGTEALKAAVSEADKREDHGVLRLYHVPGSDIGACDFQEVVGRVLVESGTFDATERGRKAAEYFEKSTNEHGISIGYRYLKGDRDDGVYDWLEIFERSVAPKDAVANSWTMFKISGGAMDAKKKSFLTEVLGKDLTEEVIMTAETMTKELEGEVAFKAESPPEDPPEDEEEGAEEEAEEPEEPTDEEEKDVSGPDETPSGGETETPDALAQLTGAFKDLLAPLAEAIAGVNTRLASIEDAQKTHAEEIKELKASDDDKIANLILGRSRPAGKPASADPGNIVDEESELGKTLKIAGNGADDPTAPYVDDLLAGAGIQR